MQSSCSGEKLLTARLLVCPAANISWQARVLKQHTTAGANICELGVVVTSSFLVNGVIWNFHEVSQGFAVTQPGVSFTDLR